MRPYLFIPIQETDPSTNDRAEPEVRPRDRRLMKRPAKLDLWPYLTDTL